MLAQGVFLGPCTQVHGRERNEEGVCHFWHSETRVSTFDLPPLPPG